MEAPMPFRFFFTFFNIVDVTHKGWRVDRRLAAVVVVLVD